MLVPNEQAFGELCQQLLVAEGIRLQPQHAPVVEADWMPLDRSSYMNRLAFAVGRIGDLSSHITRVAGSLRNICDRWTIILVSEKCRWMFFAC